MSVLVEFPYGSCDLRAGVAYNPLFDPRAGSSLSLCRLSFKCRGAIGPSNSGSQPKTDISFLQDLKVGRRTALRREFHKCLLAAVATHSWIHSISLPNPALPKLCINFSLYSFSNCQIDRVFCASDAKSGLRERSLSSAFPATL